MNPTDKMRKFLLRFAAGPMLVDQVWMDAAQKRYEPHHDKEMKLAIRATEMQMCLATYQIAWGQCWMRCADSVNGGKPMLSDFAELTDKGREAVGLQKLLSREPLPKPVATKARTQFKKKLRSLFGDDA